MGERRKRGSSGHSGGENPLHKNHTTGLDFPLTRSLLGESSSPMSERKVEQIIKAKTQSYDLYSLAELTQAGLSLTQERAKGKMGEQILTGIATYMEFPDGFAVKSLVPRSATDNIYFDKPEKDKLPQLIHLGKSILGLYEEYTEHLDTLLAIKNQRSSSIEIEALKRKKTLLERLSPLVEVFQHVSNETEDINPLSLMVIKSRDTQVLTRMTNQQGAFMKSLQMDPTEMLRQRAEFDSSIKTRNGALNIELKLIMDESIFLLPDQVVEILKSGAKASGRYDALKMKFGGLTLLDVLDEKDQQERMSKMSIFVSNIPPGDLFWLSMVRRIFFNPVSIPQRPGNETVGYSSQAYEDQMMLANALFSPAVYGKVKAGETLETVPVYEKIFERLLSNSHEDLLRWVAGSLVHISEYGPIAMERFYKSFTLQDADKLGVWFALGRESYIASHEDSRFMLIDVVMNEMMKKNRQAITQSLLDRFPGQRKQVQYFDSVMETMFHEDYSVTHAEEVAGGLSKRVHESFWKKIKEMGPDKIDLVSKKVIALTNTSELQPYWPDDQSLHNISFSPTSISGVLGFDSIHFATPYSAEETPMTAKSSIQFYLKLRDSQFGLTGSMPVDPASNEIHLSADFSGQPELISLVRLIATTSFHDLISARKIAYDRSDKRGEEEQIPSDSSEKGPSQEKKGKKKRVRSLPREKESVLDQLTLNAEDNEDVVIADELGNIIDEHIISTNSSYLPKKIDPHATALRGASEYQHAVLEYQTMQQAGVEIDVLNQQYELIQAIRKNKYNISDAKRQLVRLFPPGKVRMISDPRTGEEDYLETWVTQFWSPKPTDEELKNPDLMYEKYYKIGPQMRILDMFTALLTEDADVLTP